jgi:3-hydroxypropanoate dehydrogenase
MFKFQSSLLEVSVSVVRKGTTVTAIYESADSIVLEDSVSDLLFREARTANTFTAEPVSQEQLEAIYNLVKWAPTAINAQPLRIVAVRSDEAKERLLSHLSPGNRAKTAAAPLTVILAADTDFHETLPEVFPHNPSAKDGFADAERRTDFSVSQTWLQAGYFIVGVRAAGLAAGPMGGFDKAGVDADLLAGTALRSVVVINIGHPGPDAWFPRSPRLARELVISNI